MGLRRSTAAQLAGERAVIRDVAPLADVRGVKQLGYFERPVGNR
jgi:hypothetical protein